MYHFGPLHCGKPRERYREGRYPENYETLTISNPGLLPCEATFTFMHDNTGATFMMEPTIMSLDPRENQVMHHVILAWC